MDHHHEELPFLAGEVPGAPCPDWPTDLTTFAERTAYQRGIAHARYLACREDGYVTITTNGAGECVAVTRNDEEGRILRTLWKRCADTAPSAAQATRPAGEWVITGPDGSTFRGATPFRAALLANRHRVQTDPVAAKQFQDVIEQGRREADEENARLIAEHGTLNCPACGGSGHLGDALAASPGHPAGAEVERLTPQQAAIVGAYTGFLCGDFSALHKKIEALLGRPVWTHEMADKELMAQVRDAAEPEFLAICAPAIDAARKE